MKSRAMIIMHRAVQAVSHLLQQRELPVPTPGMGQVNRAEFP